MKTTVDIERALADEVAKVLGTRSLKDTVERALREVLAASRRLRLASRVRARKLPAPTPAELSRLRSPRVLIGGLAVTRERGR